MDQFRNLSSHMFPIRGEPTCGFFKIGCPYGIWHQVGLTRKARLVADGHLTPDPVDSTYAGVVSRESVHIALTYMLHCRGLIFGQLIYYKECICSGSHH